MEAGDFKVNIIVGSLPGKLYILHAYMLCYDDEYTDLLTPEVTPYSKSCRENDLFMLQCVRLEFRPFLPEI